MNSPIHNEMILASAGSGKTWQLTNRYIAIMAQALLAGEEVRPDRIVAVTFTRKAAGEFFDSVLTKLANAARDPEEARKLAPDPDDPLFPILSRLKSSDYANLLTVFLQRMPSLFLGTLDSFFASILRSFPAEFGLSSRFDILDEHSAHLARRNVYREVFRSRADKSRRGFLEAFKRATFGMEEARVETLLDDFVSNHHEIFLHASQPERWGDPHAIWPQGSPWAIADGDLADEFKRLFDLFAGEEVHDGQWDFWHEFRDEAIHHSAGSPLPNRVSFFLGKFLDPETWPALQNGEATITVNRRAQTLHQQACELVCAVSIRLVAAEIEVLLQRTRGIWHVLDQFESNYASLIRRRGHLTFSDLEVILAGCDLHDRTAPILSQVPEAHDRLQIDYRLDARYDHWLLDEFQDTSYLQWSVIEPLIDEAVQDVSQQRSLFQVGDVKQAIYAWRGGDTRLFHDIHERYKGDGKDPRAMRSRPLDVSWRSGPDVIDLINKVFGDAAGLEAIALPAEAVERWEWHPHTVAPPNEDLPGFAACYQTAGHRNRDVEREQCFELTHALLEQVQPVTRGLSCAILVQKNRIGRALVEYLRARSTIPVVSEADVSPALDNPVTLALLSLLRAAAHPADRFSLQHLALTPFDALLPGPPAQLSREVLGSVYRHGFERTLREWLARMRKSDLALDTFGAHRADDLALAARLFDRSGNRNVDDFLRFAGEYTVRESASPAAVQVMTIHKAKGLTFDAVILPDLGGDSLTRPRREIGVQRDRESRQVEWVFDTPLRVIVEADPVLREYHRQLEAEAGYEELCKFYVALTRARYANYLVVPPPGKTSKVRNFVRLLNATIGTSKPSATRLGEVETQVLYQSGCPTTDPHWYEQFETVEKDDSAAAPRSPSPIPALSPRPRPRRRTPSAAAGESMRAAGLFSRRGKRARDYGTLVHALFEQIEWSDDLDPDATPRQWDSCRHRAPRLFDDALKEVLRVLSYPEIAGALARPSLEAGESAACWREQSFELMANDEWISGTFDRVVIIRGPDGSARRAALLDFKTDQVVDHTEARKRADHYRTQFQTYRQALCSLLNLEAAAISTSVLFTKLPLVLTVE